MQDSSPPAAVRSSFFCSELYRRSGTVRCIGVSEPLRAAQSAAQE